MTAWGNGPFDNDDAADFMIDLEETPAWEAVRKAFTQALETTDYLGLTEGARVYAAAAFLSVALGKSEISAQDYHMIIDDLGAVPDDLAALARKALTRICAADSEIDELYQGAAYDEWIATVRYIDKALA
ncbi:DUF4259 domain-containing protein [Asticcacaulis sp. YBE204]|uniref:DUF4259 domain-containing protein n=1 Tax=Asticcacaulis sp. YBE204 TaxID=1282363 RepID=UPI0003C3BA12|nr:DUF4259 domain-containing protein [Asticcacaulis sp. YBE204]ESQ79785.1 hypothetical protein AEYBE204_08040 [Asticcacaulis sp. YBE204]